MLILAFFHAHRSDGGGEGGAGCEEASAFDFPLPPFGVRSSRKSLELGCGLKACCFFKLAAIADLMGCNGLLSALLEGGWADAAHGPPNTSHHFSPGIYELRVLL